MRLGVEYHNSDEGLTLAPVIVGAMKYRRVKSGFGVASPDKFPDNRQKFSGPTSHRQ
ncbi:hypothetical protein J6590_034635 [Homalodisca vitripennis]|nr:hypothetical protein J6590_034635 [Homalodisca vitripennis]